VQPECSKKWTASLVLASGNHILFYQATPFVEQQLDTDQRPERIRNIGEVCSLKLRCFSLTGSSSFVASPEGYS